MVAADSTRIGGKEHHEGLIAHRRHWEPVYSVAALVEQSRN